MSQMKFRKLIAYVSVCLSLVACAHRGDHIDPAKFDSAVDFMLAFQSTPPSNEKDQEYPTFRKIVRVIFKDSRDDELVKRIVGKYAVICQKKGGVLHGIDGFMNNNVYCTKQEIPESVLFALRIKDPNTNYGYGTISIYVIEPKVSPLDPAYIKDRIESEIFTQSEVENKRQKYAETVAQKNQDEESKKFLNAELQAKRQAENLAHAAQMSKEKLVRAELDRKYKIEMGGEIV
jgi:hypothetical protein